MCQESVSYQVWSFPDRITPVLGCLHWLPVSLRTNFKILLVTFKTLYFSASSYDADLLLLYEAGRSLGSPGRVLQAVSESQLKTKSDRTFAVRPFSSGAPCLRIWGLQNQGYFLNHFSKLKFSKEKWSLLIIPAYFYCQLVLFIFFIIFILYSNLFQYYLY